MVEQALARIGRGEVTHSRLRPPGKFRVAEDDNGRFRTVKHGGPEVAEGGQVAGLDILGAQHRGNLLFRAAVKDNSDREGHHKRGKRHANPPPPPHAEPLWFRDRSWFWWWQGWRFGVGQRTRRSQ